MGLNYFLLKPRVPGFLSLITVHALQKACHFKGTRSPDENLFWKVRLIKPYFYTLTHDFAMSGLPYERQNNKEVCFLKQFLILKIFATAASEFMIQLSSTAISKFLELVSDFIAASGNIIF